MTIYVVCAWYEVGMRHYSFTILNNLRKYLGADYKLHITLVLRKDPGMYPELQELAGMEINYVVIKSSFINLFTKVFPLFFDKYIEAKTKRYQANLVYILFEGLYFKNIKNIKKHCPVMYTVHDVTPHEKHKITFKDRWLSKAENERSSRLIYESDYVITNSYQQYKNIQSSRSGKTFFANMPTLINNTISSGNKAVPELRGKRFILFFGRIDKYKGLDTLINTHIHSEIDTLLVIAGSGNFWFKLPVSHKIFCINRYIDDEELNFLFTNAQLCVMPYVSITQTSLISIPYFFQCPVLLSDIPEFRELAEQTGSLICDFNRMEDYQNKVFILLNDVGKATDVTSCQSAYYTSTYDESKFADTMAQIFATVKDENIMSSKKELE